MVDETCRYVLQRQTLDSQELTRINVDVKLPTPALITLLSPNRLNVKAHPRVRHAGEPKFSTETPPFHKYYNGAWLINPLFRTDKVLHVAAGRLCVAFHFANAPVNLHNLRIKM